MVWPSYEPMLNQDNGSGNGVWQQDLTYSRDDEDIINIPVNVMYSSLQPKTEQGSTRVCRTEQTSDVSRKNYLQRNEQPLYVDFRADNYNS